MDVFELVFFPVCFCIFTCITVSSVVCVYCDVISSLVKYNCLEIFLYKHEICCAFVVMFKRFPGVRGKFSCLVPVILAMFSTLLMNKKILLQINILSYIQFKYAYVFNEYSNFKGSSFSKIFK